MHSQNTVVAIKVNGKVLRETGDTVQLPFSSEFSIYCRNLNSVRSQVSISIDGKDVTDGIPLIIEPNSSMELERFVRNGNFTSGNRFRFIERTNSIEQHRGIGVEDGIIRIEAWKELVQSIVPVPNFQYYDYWVPRPWYPIPYWMSNGTGYTSGGSTSVCNNLRGTLTSSAFNAGSFGSNSLGGSSPAADMALCNFAQSDTGITVPGSESTQQFHHAAKFALEAQSTVIVMRLRGGVGNRAIVAPVTVDIKPKCTTCGRLNRATNKFCANCGTALVLI